MAEPLVKPSNKADRPQSTVPSGLRHNGPRTAEQDSARSCGWMRPGSEPSTPLRTVLHAFAVASRTRVPAPRFGVQSASPRSLAS